MADFMSHLREAYSMAAIVAFRVRSDRLAMMDLLTAFPDLTLDLIQETATDPNRPVLIFWVEGVDLEVFERAMEEDETIGDVERYTKVGDRALYHARLTDKPELVSYPVWVEVGAEQIEAQYRDGWWYCRFRVPNTEALITIEDWCRENGVEFVLESVYSQDELDRQEAVVSTDQREILQAALEIGYFEVPREGTLEDLAGELDISSQAASERLRRGHKKLVRYYLGDSSW